VQNVDQFLFKRRSVSRRRFLQAGVTTAAGAGLLRLDSIAEPLPPLLVEAVGKLEPYFTPVETFRDVSRGTPLPHKLPEERKRKVGLTRDSWQLEVISDPENPASLRRPLSRKDGTALDFAGLMKLAERSAVRFVKTMTCLNIGCPLGTGVWEGVPLRDVVWLTGPHENVRRVFYYGYHNDDPKQMFRSSLPIDRVLEDPFDLPPVILCYKLNGQWLDSERGGPVRMVVPEAYGFKSIKWLSHVVLTNLYHANDTYAEGNNDVDSWLKTFAATLSVPREVKANEPFAITGYAQVGISGLSKVQFWIQDNAVDALADDGYFASAPWADASILGPPKNWGGTPEGKVPPGTVGFDPQTGQPHRWPMRLAKAHWAAFVTGLPAGHYTLRSRTIDANGVAQPMPRPFRKSGYSVIESVDIVVKG
jgi:DMSO/TMAO reductase YedYZ molybdopterin-dependent catalytic subunit